MGEILRSMHSFEFYVQQNLEVVVKIDHQLWSHIKIRAELKKVQ